MAVWQYDIALVPRAGVLREHGIIPEELPGYRAVWNPEDTANENFPNYWDGCVAPENFRDEVAALLPIGSSWSENAFMYGEARGHRLEIWKRDGIRFRFDVRRPDLDLMRSVVEFAHRHDLLLVSDTEGRPMKPSLEGILADLRKSDAYNFCKDPEAFLKGLEMRQNSEQTGAGNGGSVPATTQTHGPAAPGL